MTNDNRRERLARAGEWLRAARTDAGYAVQSDFARAIDVEKSLLSNYENGKSQPSTETAQKIADVLKTDIITVRRHLGLWVPAEASGGSESFSLDDIPTEDLMRYLERRLRAARPSREGQSESERTA